MICVASAQTNLAFTGFTQSFDPSVSLITLTPYPGAGLYHVGDSIGIQTSNNTPIRVMGMDGSLVYSGAVTTLHLPVGHYFVETPGDRTQFVVLPADYGNLDMLSTDATGVWGYLDTINNAFAGTWERFGGDNEWEQVQTQSNTWNWGTSDARMAVVTATGRKIVYIGAANTTPTWLDPNSSQYVQNLVTGYTNFMTAAIARYGTNIYAWEVFNEPNTITLRLGTNDAAIDSIFLALAQGAKAVRDQIAPWIKLVGPSWNSTLWTTRDNRWLHDHGIDDILDLWSWHDYDSNRHAPDQDYPGEFPPCGALTHRLLDTMGTNILSKPSYIGEMGLYGTSALGCPPPPTNDSSIYQSGLSWYRGLCRAIKLAVMYRAQNVAGIDLEVGELFANYPHSNLEIFGLDQAAVGPALPRGPHPKTSAFLMTCYWLNRTTYVGMRCPGTNVFLYAWRRADNTSMVFAWAAEGLTVPVNTNNTLAATDIFGNSVAVNSLTEMPVLFRSSSPDDDALLSNVMAALPPLNLPPVLAPLDDQNVLTSQPLQFTVSAVDPNNLPITYSADSLPAGASLNPSTGEFSWTPTLSQTGVYSVVFSVSDGLLSASNSVSITVTVLPGQADQPPVLAPIGDMTVVAGQSLAFTLSATDPDSSNLAYSADTLPSGANLVSATGAFSWTPSNSQTGTYNITFTVSDGQLTSSQATMITVSADGAPITVQVNPSNGGTTSGGGVYAIGSQMHIAATPNSGWMFTGWIDGNTQNPRTVTVREGGGTYVANLNPQTTSATVQITSGPSVTNAIMQIGSLAVVVADETNVFAVSTVDSGSNTLSYVWSFGDGAVSDPSTSSTFTHVYTNCGPYVAGVTVDDGINSTNASFTVAVACLLNVSKLQVTLNFAKANSDSCTVKGSFDLPPDYSFAGKLVTLNIGGAETAFALDDTGRGLNGVSKFNKPSYSKETGLWTFNATLRGGTWQPFWAAYGLVNTGVPKPGVSVTLPVILVIDNEAFMQMQSLQYTSKPGKSGTAK